MSKSNIVCAGIDTGKYKLDVALAGAAARRQVDNTAEGHARLSAWLRQHAVERVGIEASGGYEGAVVAHLRREGFVVIVWQPAQVRAYAKFLLQHAKNDGIDAKLVADCTAAAKTIHAPPDPRLLPFAEHLTFIEQLGEDIARLKGLLRTEFKALVAKIRSHADLAERLDLIDSVAGVGLPTAVAILVRMPELGQLSRGEAAALVGVAPYDDDSGTYVGIRHIAGGRERVRGALYAAAF